MIEISTILDKETGEYIISTVKRVKPFDKIAGIPVEYVDARGNLEPKKIKEVMDRIGFRYSGCMNLYKGCYIYVPKKLSWLYRLLNKAQNIQFPVIRWLYYRARLFQPHYPGVSFSWWDCTPLFLVKKLYRWLDWQTSNEHPANYPLWHMEPDKGHGIDPKRCKGLTDKLMEKMFGGYTLQSTCADAGVEDINLEILEKARRLLDAQPRTLPDHTTIPDKHVMVYKPRMLGCTAARQAWPFDITSPTS